MSGRFPIGIGIVVSLLCGAQGARVKAAEEDSDFQAARRWLASFKVSDATAVANSTAFPFTFATTNRIKKCEGTVKVASAMTEWLNCAHKAERVLVSELGDDAQVRAGGGTDSSAMKALLKKVSTPGTWVRAFLNGDGVAFAFRFLVVKPNDGARRIGAFLLDTDFETQ